MRKIIRNALRCRHCGDVIESKSVHDFKQCSCGAIFVDGGCEYLRRGYKTSPEEDFIDLSEYADVPGYHVAYRSKIYGFFKPYETDLAEPLNEILRRFPPQIYDLRITREDGTVIMDTFSEEYGSE
jgi:hypothetical protein